VHPPSLWRLRIKVERERERESTSAKTRMMGNNTTDHEAPTTPATPLGLQGTHGRMLPPRAHGNIAPRWRELQGANNWAGLLNPLDEDLRAEIIRYGEFTEVTYDAFDFDKHSQYCGSCKYSKKNLFKEVELHDTGYTVTRYKIITKHYHEPLTSISGKIMLRVINASQSIRSGSSIFRIAVSKTASVAFNELMSSCLRKRCNMLRKKALRGIH
jgi:hypothetical protein